MILLKRYSCSHFDISSLNKIYGVYTIAEVFNEISVITISDPSENHEYLVEKWSNDSNE